MNKTKLLIPESELAFLSEQLETSLAEIDPHKSINLVISIVCMIGKNTQDITLFADNARDVADRFGMIGSSGYELVNGNHDLTIYKIDTIWGGIIFRPNAYNAQNRPYQLTLVGKKNRDELINWLEIIDNLCRKLLSLK